MSGQLFGCRKMFSRNFFFKLFGCSRLGTMFCILWSSSRTETNQPKLVSRFRFHFAVHLGSGSGQFLSPSDECAAALALENTNVEYKFEVRRSFSVITSKRLTYLETAKNWSSLLFHRQICSCFQSTHHLTQHQSPYPHITPSFGGRIAVNFV